MTAVSAEPPCCRATALPPFADRLAVPHHQGTAKQAGGDATAHLPAVPGGDGVERVHASIRDPSGPGRVDKGEVGVGARADGALAWP